MIAKGSYNPQIYPLVHFGVLHIRIVLPFCCRKKKDFQIIVAGARQVPARLEQQLEQR